MLICQSLGVVAWGPGWGSTSPQVGSEWVRSWVGRCSLDAQAASGFGNIGVPAVGSSRGLLGVGTKTAVRPPVLPFDLEHFVVGVVGSLPFGVLFALGNQLLGLLPDGIPLVNSVAEG